MRQDYSLQATCGAGIAVIFWSACALIFCLLDTLPCAQLLGIAMTVGGISSICVRGELPSLKTLFSRSPLHWLAISTMLLNQIFYTHAFRSAPAAQVDLINYLWPLMVVVTQSLIRSERLRGRHFAGIAIGFAGPALLIGQDVIREGVQLSYIWGYLLALGAAVTWATYSLMGRWEDKTGSKVGDHLLVAGVGCLLFQSFAGWQPMSGNEVLIVLFLGVAVFGASYPLWVNGLAKGHYTLVGGMANAIPILSIALLIIGGRTEMSMMLTFASALVVAGCVCLGGKAPKQKKAAMGKRSRTAKLARASS